MKMQMKTKNKLLYAFMIFILILTACCTTSDSKTVNQSKADALLKTAPPDIDYNFPLVYKDTFLSKDKKIQITFAAEVIAPEVEKYPVIHIDPTPISRELMQLVVDEFLEGETGTYPAGYMTTSEIEKRLHNYELKLNDESVLKEEYEKNFGEDVEVNYDQVREAVRNRITEFTAMLEGAPEERDDIASELNLRPDYFYTSNDYKVRNMDLSLTQEEIDARMNNPQENLYLVSDKTLSNGDNMRLIVYSEVANVYESFHFGEHYEIQVIRARNDFLKTEGRPLTSAHPLNSISRVENFDVPYPYLTISEVEAVEIAQEVLEDLGIDNFYIAYTRIRKESRTLGDYENYDFQSAENKFYMLTFKPMYNDIPLIQANNRFPYQQQYPLNYYFEEITMKVSNDVVVEFRWINPTDISNVINDSVVLMDFDKIMKLATKHMKQHYSLENVANVPKDMPNYEQELANFLSADINITEIRLGLAGVPSYDIPYEYMLIPVWSFYGSVGWETSDNSRPNMGEISPEPIISINAVDGSIVEQFTYIDWN